jgi:hypothetical protein
MPLLAISFESVMPLLVFTMWYVAVLDLRALRKLKINVKAKFENVNVRLSGIDRFGTPLTDCPLRSASFKRNKYVDRKP